jgi:hypothetical protein
MNERLCLESDDGSNLLRVEISDRASYKHQLFWVHTKRGKFGENFTKKFLEKKDFANLFHIYIAYLMRTNIYCEK